MSQEQLDICFNRHRGASTSVAAHRSTPPEHRKKQRDDILNLLKQRGGLTCEETATILNFRYTACSARMSELQRDGLIIDSERRRPTQTGRPARVMVARNG